MQNRVMGTLDLRGGCLLVCGGFDPRGLAVWLDGDDESMGDVVAVSVSPSWYKVAVSLAWRCRRGLDLAAVGAQASSSETLARAKAAYPGFEAWVEAQCG